MSSPSPLSPLLIRLVNALAASEIDTSKVHPQALRVSQKYNMDLQEAMTKITDFHLSLLRKELEPDVPRKPYHA